MCPSGTGEPTGTLARSACIIRQAGGINLHPSALYNGDSFFRTYGPYLPPKSRCLDVGAYDVNGSLRQVAPAMWQYVGVDFSAGPGVDVVLEDPYYLPFPDGSFDVAVSTSCFEHSEFFWLSFLEILRVLSPRGLFYLNAPSNGSFHRYPVDCWRFFPDSGKALEKWAKRNQVPTKLLESFVSYQQVNPWNDLVAVFLKDGHYAAEYPKRMYSERADVENVHSSLHNNLLKFTKVTEDLRRLKNK